MRIFFINSVISLFAMLLIQISVYAADVDVMPSLSYSDINCEAVLLNKGTLHIEVEVKNNKPSTKFVLYIATYSTATNQLYDIKPILQTIANGATAPLSFDYDASSAIQNNRYIKVFVWEQDNLTPHLTQPLTIKTTEQDLFGDTIQTATPINIVKPTEGKINSSTDIDFVKFTPTVTGEYIIQTTGNTNTAGVLYNSSKTSIASNNNISSQDDNFMIRQTLIAGQTYYISVGSELNSTGNYVLTITPYSRNAKPSVISGNISVSGTVTSTVGNSKSAAVKLLNSSGMVLSTRNVTTTSNGALNTAFAINVLSGKYRIVVLYSNKVCEVIDLNVSVNKKAISVNMGDDIIIPFAVRNVTLSNVEFSLNYSSDDVSISNMYGSNEISKITEAQSYVIFKSTSTNLNWSGTANVVTLQAKRPTTANITTYTYQVN